MQSQRRSLPLVCAQSKWSEPDYQKFAVEPGAQLEVWSWVVGLDSVAKDFEKEFPNIKIKVDNIGGGPTEYQKLQTAIKAGSGAPDTAQIEYDFLPSFIVTDGLADLTPLGAEQAIVFRRVDLGTSLTGRKDSLWYPAGHRAFGADV